MVYTTGLWGEEQAANGLTGTACLDSGADGFAVSGDKLVFPANTTPWIWGFGATGDTKPQGCALLPDNSNGNKHYYGPGGQIYHLNWLDLQKIGGSFPLMPNDSVTGQTSSTNVNEGTVLGCHIGFGPAPAYPTRKQGRVHYQELMTITSAAAVTANSGAATIYAASTNTTNFYDPKARYVLNGVSGHLSAATFGGILTVSGLGGSWKGLRPGIPISALSAVNFASNQPYTPFPQPIGPITGWELANTAKIGMCASTAGAINFVLHISKL